MPSQTFAGSGAIEAPPGSHTTVNNTVTRTNLWVPSLWTPINAFDMRAGKVYLLRAGGVIGTTGTPTIIFNPTFGQSGTPSSNTALGVSNTITLGSGLSAVSWWAEFVLVVRSLAVAASSATITGNGSVHVNGAAAAVGQLIPIGGTVVTNADHTTAQGLCLDVTWGTANASNTITAQWTYLAPQN